MSFVNCSRLALSYCRSQVQCARKLSLSQVSRIKEIIEKKEGDTLTISAEVKPQNDPYLMKKTSDGACPLCSYGLEVKHTDILIINQFLDSQGNLIPRKISGLCYVQHKRMDYLVEMAKAAGLLNNYAKQEVPKDKKWKNLNTYFDEQKIQYKYYINKE